jgi:hypothetical protein
MACSFVSSRYWLQTMDAVRTWPALHTITASLLAATWGQNRGTYKARSAEERIGAGQELAIYADRANLRLPAYALPYPNLRKRATKKRLELLQEQEQEQEQEVLSIEQEQRR